MRIFIIFFYLLLTISNNVLAESKPLHLSTQEAQYIGQKIWQNEGDSKVENLTVWNRGENFPSFGIGHFIWYPADVDAPFTESFPALLEYLQKTVNLPPWLLRQGAAPWTSRSQFYSQINTPQMVELRELLIKTIPQQTQFIINRLNASLPKIIATIEDPDERVEISARFYQVAQSPQGLYALIDYVNFKGEGTSQKERYRGKGWGLLQILENMEDVDPDHTMKEFVRAADFVLTRRVNNAPRNESQWLLGWRKRLKSYLPH